MQQVQEHTEVGRTGSSSYWHIIYALSPLLLTERQGSPGAGDEARLQGEMLSVLAGDTSKEDHPLLSGSRGQLLLVTFGDSVS